MPFWQWRSAHKSRRHRRTCAPGTPSAITPPEDAPDSTMDAAAAARTDSPLRDTSRRRRQIIRRRRNNHPARRGAPTDQRRHHADMNRGDSRGDEGVAQVGGAGGVAQRRPDPEDALERGEQRAVAVDGRAGVAGLGVGREGQQPERAVAVHPLLPGDEEHPAGAVGRGGEDGRHRPRQPVVPLADTIAIGGSRAAPASGHRRPGSVCSPALSSARRRTSAYHALAPVRQRQQLEAPLGTLRGGRWTPVPRSGEWVGPRRLREGKSSAKRSACHWLLAMCPWFPSHRASCTGALAL